MVIIPNLPSLSYFHIALSLCMYLADFGLEYFSSYSYSMSLADIVKQIQVKLCISY